ncbi:mucin-binding protein, partial [Ligilactobacillus apodemi]|uniref:mucin-binding protein n=1 Tax=Ligilactobacillus apodemi TaxID=307126 RepID=UPI00214ACC9D
MVSKNNKNLYLRRSADRVSKYTIKKLSIGAASVLLSTTFFLGSSTSASASTDDQGSSSSTETTETTAASTISDSNVTLKSSKVTADDEASTSTTSTNDATESQSTPTSETAASTTSEAATTQANANASSSSTTSSTDSASASSTSEAVNENTQVENSKQAPTESNSTVSNNNNSAATSETASQASDAQSTASDAVASAATSVADSVASSEAETTASASATPTSAVAMLSASDTQTTHEVTVSDWAQLVSAMSNSNYQQINVEGTLTATGDGNIGSVGHTVTISGSDNAGINFGSNILTATGGSWNITFANLNVVTGNASGVVDLSKTTGENTVTFDNVTASGTSLYGGGGNTAVVISGDTTSTVDNAGENNEANIHDASSVTVAKGASFTINRSSIGDGINLPDGSAVVVSDDAKLTINMNTNNATDKARYHNAGVFMNKGGSFTSGRNSVVTMNTSIGQAIAIGAGRPSSTDSDRFGGYGTNQSRYDGPSTVTLGTNSTFNFTGRDGIILGNNSTFTSGEYSTVHFQNKGRGVALDLANDSNIIISKHSNTLFESDGKTKTGGTPSGSYDGYNYIGVNERGNITIDEYATFRVILTNRGDNNWDDVISLDSRSSSSNAAFTSKKGAVIDIRDDNTNFYAELISFPLGNANSKIDIEDPLYVNFQRYSAGGAITGWMAGVGGDKIQNTSDKTTANLLYMGGNKGTIRMGGTDYIVYQDIKADGAQQIWLNVNEVTFKKNGFDNDPKNDNGANPDLSISGTGLVAGVAANDVKEDSGNANGHYGISSRRAAQQIWISHETTNEASGVHKNTIRYVDEDGNEIFPSVTQEVDMMRDMTLSFSDDDIEAIKEYAKTHSADEILNYLKDLYTVTKDSGWQIANAVNTTTAYDAVTTPVLEGYTAKIQSTNANGVKVGDDASTVQATLVIPEDAVVKDGKLTAEYMNNGYTGIPANYETVVVYTKEVKDQTVTVVYQDKTDNKVLATDTVSGKPGTNVDYSTADQIKTLEAQGYKLVTDGYPGTSTTFGDQPETYYVVFEHATEDQDVQKDVKETVHYVGAGDQTPADNVQTATWTKTVTVDKVTGETVKETEWTPNKTNYDEVKTPAVTGYVADKETVPSTAVTQDDIEVIVTYSPVQADAQKAVINYVDQDNDNSVLATDSVTGDSNEKINYSTADKIKELTAKGYELVSDGFPTDATFDDDSSVDQVYTVVLKHATQTVTPNDPQKPGDPINPDDPEGPKWPAGTDKDSVQKDVTETVHYVGAGENTPADVVQNATWTRTVTVDKVTGEIVASTDWTPSKDNYDEVKTPVVDGYVADQASVPSTAVTQDNIEKTVTYTAVGKIVPVDPDG